MTLCFPISEDKGLDSTLYEHFGSAPMFLLVDAGKRSVSQVINRDINPRHGACRPLKALGGNNVGAVIVSCIGAGALSGLKLAGYKVYQAQPGTVAENMDEFLLQRLSELTPEQTCGEHQHQHCTTHDEDKDFELGCGF